MLRNWMSQNEPEAGNYGCRTKEQQNEPWRFLPLSNKLCDCFDQIGYLGNANDCLDCFGTSLACHYAFSYGETDEDQAYYDEHPAEDE